MVNTQKKCAAHGMVTGVKQFAEIVKGMMESRYGNNCRITVQEVTKNNGIRLTGISIQEEGCNIAPNIYLDGFFGEYREGRELEDICREVEQIYRKCRVRRNFDTGSFMDFGIVREKICFRLVNAERNRELLAKIPHRRYLDLAVVYYVLFSDEGENLVTTLITDRVMQMWGINEATLHEYAERNTSRLLKGYVCSMEDILFGHKWEMPGIREEADRAEACRMDFTGSAMMYVASNAAKVNGAAVVLYDGVLKKFARKVGGDFYVLPSSTHEVLFLPVSEVDMDGAELARMVREVNQNEVAEDEVLSEHAYRYFAEADRMEIVG